MQDDKEVLLQDKLFLYIRYAKKKSLFRKDFTITINDRELRNVSFQDKTCVDTSLCKGEFIKDVFVCTGSVKTRGYCFSVRDCVEELHLRVDEKGNLTLNHMQPVLSDSKGCLLM